jgi:polyisoprenoid-binding protein YceI
MFLFFFSFIFCSSLVYAQKYTTGNAYVGFFSKTPLEDIRAENRQVRAVIDVNKQQLAFTLLVKSFLFRKQLMQQHFNESYAESDKYPKADFSGIYTGIVNYLQDGIYPIEVKGNLTFHGVTKSITVPATLEIRSGKLTAVSKFKLKPQDFNIKIPAVVRDKIAEQIDVSVKAEFLLK